MGKKASQISYRITDLADEFMYLGYSLFNKANSRILIHLDDVVNDGQLIEDKANGVVLFLFRCIYFKDLCFKKKVIS